MSYVYHIMEAVDTIGLQYKSIKLPYELINIILEYDGRIKYKYKQSNSIDYHKYVNIIHKNDSRYETIKPVIVKKIYIMKYELTTSPNDNSFYFQFTFDNQPMVVLCYDYNSYNNQFEICYTDMKGSGHVLGSDQTRHICI